MNPIKQFDLSEHLKTDQDMLEFLQAALEEASESQNTGVFISAFNAVVDLKGVDKEAAIMNDDSNSSLESLYLLGSPVNAEKLSQAMATLEVGRGRAIDLDDVKKL